MNDLKNNRQQFKPGTESGFSLVELIFVVVIIGMIAAIATPLMRDWIRNADLNSDVRHVYSAIQFARSEAVKRNMTCRVERNLVVANCNNGFGDRAIAGQPYDFVVSVDLNNSNSFDPGEELLCGNLGNRIIAAPDAAWIPIPNHPDATFRGAAPGPADTLLQPPLTISGRGLPNSGGTLVIEGTTMRAFSIIMNSTGRLRVE